MRNWMNGPAVRRRAAGALIAVALLAHAPWAMRQASAAPKNTPRPTPSRAAPNRVAPNRIAPPPADARPTTPKDARPTPPASNTPAPLDTSVPPPSLPRASREKMRACADEWAKKKMATTTGLPMWRRFATECLTRDR